MQLRKQRLAPMCSPASRSELTEQRIPLSSLRDSVYWRRYLGLSVAVFRRRQEYQGNLEHHQLPVGGGQHFGVLTTGRRFTAPLFFPLAVATGIGKPKHTPWVVPACTRNESVTSFRFVRTGTGPARLAVVPLGPRHPGIWPPFAGFACVASAAHRRTGRFRTRPATRRSIH
jgi:hypothetical protein